jgi:hypothetical protein
VKQIRDCSGFHDGLIQQVKRFAQRLLVSVGARQPIQVHFYAGQVLPQAVMELPRYFSAFRVLELEQAHRKPPQGFFTIARGSFCLLSRRQLSREKAKMYGKQAQRQDQRRYQDDHDQDEQPSGESLAIVQEPLFLSPHLLHDLGGFGSKYRTLVREFALPGLVPGSSVSELDGVPEKSDPVLGYRFQTRAELLLLRVVAGQFSQTLNCLGDLRSCRVEFGGGNMVGVEDVGGSGSACSSDGRIHVANRSLHLKGVDDPLLAADETSYGEVGRMPLSNSKTTADANAARAFCRADIAPLVRSRLRPIATADG